jgi:hypothetical protein
MNKILFIIKDDQITRLIPESLGMSIPDDYDYILWLPLSIWFGNHVLFSTHRDVNTIQHLNPKTYTYDPQIWAEFYSKINYFS